MSTSDQPTVKAAAAALQTYGKARAAAAGSRPTPAWYPPARGLLAALTYALGPALLPGRWQPWLVGLLLVSALAFLAVHGAAVRPGGVLVLPKDDPRRRAKLRAHWQSLPVYGLGWLAAVPGGVWAGSVTSALLLGGFLWATSEYERRLAARR
ncbi:hypothetical protein [Kitasatospora azatica]|uniref:hypothetical protein n=1 Tax=Kitasatospora azatica TaxID=58347 RepID=UPI0006908007|nr:hypothetical protein [Kitasatospora azatica]